MLRKVWLLGLLAIALAALISWTFADPQKTEKGKSREPVVIAQISDTHLGLKRAPDAADNLRKVVQMVNDRQPDAVIVSGDVGERTEAWEEARDILRGLKARMFVVPGNHDVSQKNLDRWRSFWGKDYDQFQIKYVTILSLDSQLMGNYDDFHAREALPLSPQNAAEAKNMFDWLAEKAKAKKRDRGTQLVFAMQHVPNSRADGGSFPKDPKPYWTTQEPYRSQAIELLHDIGVKHVFAGHWHKGMVYEADGFTYHLAPSTSWSDWDDHLGFAVHTINPDGDVKTEFVNLPGADTHPTR